MTLMYWYLIDFSVKKSCFELNEFLKFHELLEGIRGMNHNFFGNFLVKEMKPTVIILLFFFFLRKILAEYIKQSVGTW